MHNKFSSCLDVELPRVYPGAKVVEERRALCRQTLVQRDHWFYLIKDSNSFNSKIFLTLLIGA